MIDGQQCGPYELEQLPEAGIRPSTYIWCSGMSDWEKAEDVADVCRLYRNRLYDIMHPNLHPEPTEGERLPIENSQIQGAENPSPTNFDRYLKDEPEAHIPTLEEIDSQKDTSVAPQSMIGYAWLVTILCFPPTGIAALYYAYRSRSAWKKGEAKISHDLTRSAKMMTGISVFLGLIAWSVIFSF